MIKKNIKSSLSELRMKEVVNRFLWFFDYKEMQKRRNLAEFQVVFDKKLIFIFFFIFSLQTINYILEMFL